MEGIIAIIIFIIIGIPIIIWIRIENHFSKIDYNLDILEKSQLSIKKMLESLQNKKTDSSAQKSQGENADAAPQVIGQAMKINDDNPTVSIPGIITEEDRQRAIYQSIKINSAEQLKDTSTEEMEDDRPQPIDHPIKINVETQPIDLSVGKAINDEQNAVETVGKPMNDEQNAVEIADKTMNDEQKSIEIAGKAINGEQNAVETVGKTCIDSQTVNQTTTENQNASQPTQQILSKKENTSHNLEKFIGENLFGKLGILIFILGIGFFVKYAIDKDWINEIARTILGFSTAIALLIIAERLHKRYRAFSSLLAGGAFGIFYITTAIAFHYYGIFSQNGAFATLCATTVLMTAISIIYNRSELAATALVGGFIAPFIVSTQNSNIVTLLIYLSILNMGMAALATIKRWAILPMLSFIFTYAIITWEMFGIISPEPTPLAAKQLFVFITLAFIIFHWSSFHILKSSNTKSIAYILMGMLVGNSTIYHFIGCYLAAYMPAFKNIYGAVPLFVAAVNFLFYAYLRYKKTGKTMFAGLLLTLSLAFLSITVPIQFRGSDISIIWTVEAIVLLWLYIKTQSRVYETFTAIVSAFALLYYFSTNNYLNAWPVFRDEKLFLNAHFIPNLFVSLCWFVFASIMHRFKTIFTEKSRLLVYTPFNAFMYFVSIFIMIITFLNEVDARIDIDYHDADYYLSTAGVIAAYVVALRHRFSVENFKDAYLVFIGIITLLYMYTTLIFHTVIPCAQILMQWLTTAIVLFILGFIVCRIAKFGMLHKQYQLQAYFSVIATIVWLSMVKLFMLMLGTDEFNTSFSLSLGIMAFGLMYFGMRTHNKPIRMVSLIEFGIVLTKLVIIDVWEMQPIGKIIVFISIGAILLTLSFLYQKLKNVLFGEEDRKKEIDA